MMASWGLILKCFGEVCFVLLCLGSFLLPLQLCKDNNRANRTGDLSPSLPLIKSHFLGKLWQTYLPSPSDNLSIMQIICLLYLISSYPTSDWYLVWVTLNGVNIISLTYGKALLLCNVGGAKFVFTAGYTWREVTAVLKVLPQQFITKPAVCWGLWAVNGRRGGKSKLIILWFIYSFSIME